MVRLFFLLSLAACIPGRHPVIGAACDLDHPCPDDLDCINQVCVEPGGSGGGSGTGGGGGAAGGGATAGGSASACPNNLLEGGGFEDGQLATLNWVGMFTAQGATVRSGAFAARLTSSSSATLVLRSQLTAIDAVDDRDHCADAWVRSSTTTGPIGLQLGRWLAGPDLSAEATVTPDGTWQKISQRFAYPSGHVGLIVQVNVPLSAGGEAFVDDVCVQVCP